MVAAVSMSISRTCWNKVMQVLLFEMRQLLRVGKVSRMGESFVPGYRRDSVAANMTEMPEVRLDWALEDTQRVSIRLSSPNLIGPFPGGPRPFWKAAPHPAGRARRS